LAIECEELLALLDDRLREVAILRLHGYTNQEIAEQLGRSVKSVERYLKLIRVEWMDV
jgi:DNA-binding NarL/FixJ family response regulator